MKGYTVFNVEQIEGLPAHYYAARRPATRHGAADRGGGPVLRQHRGRHPSWREPRLLHRRTGLRADAAFVSFRDAESYYSTLAHEMTHWTKHPARLDRDFGRKKFGDEGYAREELVAEIGAAFLCCDLGITPEPRDDHAAYLGHWLKVLKGDKRAIFQAAAHAQRAVDFLHGLQPGGEDTQDREQGRPAMTGVVRFPLGQVAITANASLRLTTEEVLTALRRHASGDWGDLCPEDTLANDTALQQGGRLFSAYGQGQYRFWVITEADRSVTTVLLPEDY